METTTEIGKMKVGITWWGNELFRLLPFRARCEWRTREVTSRKNKKEIPTRINV